MTEDALAWIAYLGWVLVAISAGFLLWDTLDDGSAAWRARRRRAQERRRAEKDDHHG
jgi:hypothetical protein